MEALGQAGSGFLVATAGDTILLVDPHAAHEKVLYTELLARWRKHDRDPSDSQLLLIPVVVECPPDRASRVADEHDFFSRCGFSIEQFGRDAVRCTAVPMAAARANPEVLVAAIIDRVDERDAGTEERRHRLAALVACHAAVRFGDRLDVSPSSGSSINWSRPLGERPAPTAARRCSSSTTPCFAAHSGGRRDEPARCWSSSGRRAPARPRSRWEPRWRSPRRR